jgi:hypothetical protein
MDTSTSSLVASYSEVTVTVTVSYVTVTVSLWDVQDATVIHDPLGPVCLVRPDNTDGLYFFQSA